MMPGRPPEDCWRLSDVLQGHDQAAETGLASSIELLFNDVTGFVVFGRPGRMRKRRSSVT